MPSTKRPHSRRSPVAARLCGAWVAAAVLLLVLPAAAEFYRYTDPEGQVHYVDDPHHIPDSQLDTMQVYKDEARNNAAPEEQGLDGRSRREEATTAAVKGDRDNVAPRPPGVLESPVIVQGNRVLVPVEIGYLGRKVKAHLLFDTGASFTILHQKVARRILLVGKENREAVVVGGSRIPIRMAKVDYIQVGPYKVTNAEVAIIRHQGLDQGHQGLLGMNILRNLNYTLDVNRGVIVWNR